MSRTSLPRRSNGSDVSRRAETFLPSRRYRIPMRVYVVDNGGQWTHREWRGLEELRGGTKNVPHDSPVSGPKEVGGPVPPPGAPPPGLGPEEKGKNGGKNNGVSGPLLPI